MGDLGADFDVADRVVLVTGASSGLGRAIAVGLRGAGARVVGVARRADRLRDLEVEYGVVPVPGDLEDLAALPGLVSEARNRVGAVDVLVNCAGASGRGSPAEDEDVGAVARLLHLNCVVPLRLAQLVFPDMVAAGGGVVVNVSSISGVTGIGRIPQAGYAASKHALTGLTRELALQWGRHGIRVVGVAPGFFESEMSQRLFANPGLVEWMESRQALPGHLAAHDVASVVVYLMSPAAAWITGQTIAVDGGWTAS